MKLKNPMTGWKANGDILTIIGFSVVGAYMYVLFLSILSIVFNHDAFVSNFYICIKEDPPKYKTGLSLTSSLVLGSLLLAVLLSVALDLFSLWKLRKLEKNMTHPNQPPIPSIKNLESSLPNPETRNTRKIIDEMPIRSSLINTLFLFQYLFFIIFLGYIGRALKFQKLDILGFLSIPYIAITIFRTWLVATLTFQKNGANRQRRNADEEREQLRQIEIQDALRKRQSRNHGRIAFSVNIFNVG